MTDLLILDDHALDYAAELERRDTGLTIALADTVEAIRDAASIWLAQPDLAAAALGAGRPAPRWLQSTWAGVAPILPATEQFGFVLTGLKGIFGPLIAEYVFTYVLAQVRLADHYRKAQHRKAWSPVWPGTLRDRVMAIVGTGSIGAAVAAAAGQFRMRVIGVSRSGAAVPGFDHVFGSDELQRAVADADYVVSCLPATADTAGLIDRDAFEAMAPGAVFINVGRGNAIDEHALLDAVTRGHLGGAVLDVFSTEPLPTDSPLWHTPGITVTPHVAGVTYARDVIDCFVHNLARHRDGAPLAAVVDARRGY